MYLDHRLGGRQERRLPVMVAVNLAPLEPTHRERHERTYTDNLSAHGARVRATCAWQLGEHAESTPVSGEATVRGTVVYCQRLDNDRFFVGCKIRERHMPGPSLRGLWSFD